VPGLPSALAAAAALAMSASGCASLWAINEAVQGKPPLESAVESETVPLPGVTEKLGVRAYLAGRASTDPTVTRRPAALLLQCQVTQTGQEIMYRAATRYGTSWKVWTALAFVVEGGISALNFYEGVHGVGNHILLGWMTADAVGTGILFFVPERAVYERNQRPHEITVREECPGGLVLEAGGQPVSITPAGTADEVGQKLIDAQLAMPVPVLRLRLAAFAGDVPVSRGNRCAWARARAPDMKPSVCATNDDYADAGIAEMKLDLAIGTATGFPVTGGPR
jgi:hypothetical protein